MKKKELIVLIKSSLKAKSEINEKSSDSNVDEWDSLGSLSILTALDKKTKGKTSKISTLANANSVKKIIDILIKEKILKE
tara:strand:+ start:828 stop:1067 length:240 start_codon:yes stop_codon:yes gene_type:complete